MNDPLADALDEVLAAQEQGQAITMDWLAARYPTLYKALWEALQLGRLLADREGKPPDPDAPESRTDGD